MSKYSGLGCEEVTMEMIRGGLGNFSSKYVKNAKERYEEKVLKTNDGCWDWDSAVKGNGYPAFSFKNKNLGGHQFSYLLHKGPITDDYVLHKCGTKICTNPDHLYSGDHSDNLKDAYDLGEREPMAGPKPKIRNENHGQCKLSKEDVREIRRLYEQGFTQREIAEKFDISRPYVGEIARKERRKYVN